MEKRIQTPLLLEESAGEFQLRFAETSIRQAALNNLPPEERMDAILGFLAMPGPQVSMAMPQWWNLTPYLRQHTQKYAAAAGLAESLRQLREVEYFLIRMGCAFYPDVEKTVKSAGFTTYLRPQLGKKEVVLLDLFPKQVDVDRSASAVTHLHVRPNISFATGSIPEEETVLDIEYKSLIPLIKTSQEDPLAPRWDFSTRGNDGLSDVRYVYLLVQKPRLAKHVIVRQDIDAQVRTSLGILSADIREKERTRLTHTICAEWIEV
jgi:hypothetical protein